jgi:hypothetical protein
MPRHARLTSEPYSQRDNEAWRAVNIQHMEMHGKGRPEMRKQFPGYYRPTSADFAQKVKECVFCFDTNVLLNLYRYTPESRENLIKVLQAVKDRVWLPHQVGIEYQRRRIEVLLGQLNLAGKLEGHRRHDVGTGQAWQIISTVRCERPH